MGRKGKTQKHTAKEIAAKTKAAKERGGAAGGGGGGMAARLAVMKNQDVICEACKQAMPNLSSMKAHWDSKHSKLPMPDYAAQYKALKDAKRAAQKAKGTSAAGKGKKVKKKK